MNITNISDFRNSNFRDSVDFVPEEFPLRVNLKGKAFSIVHPHDVKEYAVAQFEIRHVLHSRNIHILPMSTILFARVAKDSFFATPK